MSGDEIEPASLQECEQVIERGLATFMEVGSALLRIRDDRLYRSEYRDFESYCQNRWSIGRTRAYELMGAADMVARLSGIPNTPLPTNAGQADELSGLDTETAAEVMTEAHAATGGAPTAAAIHDARARVTRLDDVITEAEWEAEEEPDPDMMAGHPDPEIDRQINDLKASRFAANVRNIFYMIAKAEARLNVDRIAEVAQDNAKFEETLRDDIAESRRWFKKIDAALAANPSNIRTIRRVK